MSYHYKEGDKRVAEPEACMDAAEPEEIKGGTQGGATGPKPAAPRPIPTKPQQRSRTTPTHGVYNAPRNTALAEFPSPGTSPGYTLQPGRAPHYEPRPYPPQETGVSEPQRPSGYLPQGPYGSPAARPLLGAYPPQASTYPYPQHRQGGATYQPPLETPRIEPTQHAGGLIGDNGRCGHQRDR